MSRFNKTTPVPRTTPIVSTPSPLARTGNNAPGFVRDPQGELFLLAVSNFVGMDTFYEKADNRDARYLTLVHHLAHEDPDWLGRFLKWLRSEANMRTAAIIGAVEAARIMAHHKIPGGRQIVNSVLQRADEPGEALGYWMSTYPGRQIPKPIKRGVADAVTRLYTQYSMLKYDTASKDFRFADVIDLVHPSPESFLQSDLFKVALERRHNRADLSWEGLPMVYANAKLREAAARGDMRGLYEAETLHKAGMNWEDVLSLAGNKIPKNELWEAMIPNMGYMALLRNLRNFDEAGIGALSAQYVLGKLTHPDEVARSRQLPMRFLAAHRNVPSLRWGQALEEALQLSLNNIPKFKGRTLILIDTSGSMADRMSDRSELQRWDAAAIFGLALSQRCEKADVISFSNSSKVFPLQRGASLLVMLEAFRRGYFQGMGTATEAAVRSNFRAHDRVIILTDEQANYHQHHDVAASVPANIPVITFNLAGYKAGHMESGSATRITIGGLSDAAFRLLPVLEKRASGGWPF